MPHHANKTSFKPIVGSVIKLICSNCSLVFERYKSELRNVKGTNHYCSRVCMDNHFYIKYRGDLHHNYTPNIGKRCAYCKQMFFAKPSKIHKRKFCSRSCMNRGRIRPKFYDTEEYKDKRRALAIMSRLSQTNNISKPELRFIGALLSNDIKDFIFQFPYKLGIADFFIFPNIIVECDGEYWHKDRKENDSNKNKWFKSNGFQLFRFSDKNINKDVNTCISKLNIY